MTDQHHYIPEPRLKQHCRPNWGNGMIPGGDGICVLHGGVIPPPRDIAYIEDCNKRPSVPKCGCENATMCSARAESGLPCLPSVPKTAPSASAFEVWLKTRTSGQYDGIRWDDDDMEEAFEAGAASTAPPVADAALREKIAKIEALRLPGNDPMYYADYGPNNEVVDKVLKILGDSK